MSPRPPPGPTILSIKALVTSLRRWLEDEFGDLRVRGEIASFTHAASGHCYFTLKDAHAQVRAMMFRAKARHLRFSPKEGMEVIARGRISVYEPRGEMQLIVESLEPAGEGALAQAFERLKKELAAKGYFDQERKRPIPESPSCVGVVTSLSAAALFDTLRILLDRQPGLHIIVSPTPVQGFEAPEKIARALTDLDRTGLCQTLLLVRGGGSPEDLWAFNDARVVEAVVKSRTPVICGVGHEIDLTLADLAADLRSPTPTAAAQAAVPDHRAQILELGRALRRLANSMEGRLRRREQRLDELWRRMEGELRGRVALISRDFDSLRRRLLRAEPRRRLTIRRQELKTRYRNLRAAMHRQLEAKGRRLDGARALMPRLIRNRLRASSMMWEALNRPLHDLSPLAILGRGYAIVQDPRTRKVVRRASDHPPGARLDVRLREGELEVAVIQVRKGKG